MPGRPVAQHQLNGFDRKVRPTAAVDVGASAQPHAVFGLDLRATLLDPLDQRLRATPRRQEDRRRRQADDTARQSRCW